MTFQLMLLSAAPGEIRPSARSTPETAHTTMALYFLPTQRYR